MTTTIYAELDTNTNRYRKRIDGTQVSVGDLLMQLTCDYILETSSDGQNANTLFNNFFRTLGDKINSHYDNYYSKKTEK